jgi:hypothetical protein
MNGLCERAEVDRKVGEVLACDGSPDFLGLSFNQLTCSSSLHNDYSNINKYGFSTSDTERDKPPKSMSNSELVTNAWSLLSI